MFTFQLSFESILLIILNHKEYKLLHKVHNKIIAPSAHSIALVAVKHSYNFHSLPETQ